MDFVQDFTTDFLEIQDQSLKPKNEKGRNKKRVKRVGMGQNPNRTPVNINQSPLK